MDFGSGFLERVRDLTERAWADPYLGLGWQPGTRWRGGMSEDEVSAVEGRYGFKFPPDYRLFLTTLHTTDPERAQYRDGEIRMLTGRPFRDWQDSRSEIDEANAWPLEGLLWSIEADQSWTSRWGRRPDTPDERAALVREHAQVSPPLIPVMGHRYLFGHPLRSGNPVLSIYGADTIVYAATFGAWLVEELASMVDPAFRALAPAPEHDLEPIPFWQDVIDDEGWSRDTARR